MLVVTAGTAAGRPGTLAELGEDTVSEHISRPRKSKRDVCMEALELRGAARAADPELERRTAVLAATTVRKLAPHSPLILGSGSETGCELRITRRFRAPALDAARGLEPGHCGGEMPAGEVVRRGEGIARSRVRILFRHRRPAERTADRDATKRSCLPPELPRDKLPIVHLHPSVPRPPSYRGLKASPWSSRVPHVVGAREAGDPA